MTTRVISLVRYGLKLLASLALAIVGFFAFLAVGWVPPELAAMLGSRRHTLGSGGPAAASESAEDRATLPDQD